ncbi:HTH domain-containing protein [Photobacterium sanctipauli]|uniref:Ribokinase n=1 Tax=Photobacterium sanctipauli TaxID=1342794 RepID=A0A2T3NX40_9GAMM|nr:PfkB family carbohydrate kinase [Photobacterium sanctipauli]PSW20782.1 HTH domain-containing protein [Photobacterium sanctipauli]
MNKQERIRAIRILLLQKKKVFTSDLVRQFSVTERTIRRDLKTLEDSGIAQLFFGGAKVINLVEKDIFKETGIKKIMMNLGNKYSQANAAAEKEANTSEVYILGSFNVDIVTEVSSFPTVGQTIHAKSTNFYAGGKGSNQATAAAKVSDAVHFTVKIGKDEFGEKARNYFSSTQLKSLTVMEDEEKPTGNAVVLVSESERDNMITIDLGANENIHEDEISDDLVRIQDAKVFLTQLENNFAITRMAVEYASRTNALVMLNPAPYVDDVKTIINMIDLITPNETEAEELSGVAIHSLEDAKKAAQVIHEMGPKIVIITLGSKGCLVFDGEAFHQFEPFKAVVADTSGAGDSFNGALAACLANGKPLFDAINYASAFASLAVERKGASNMPDDALVQARLALAK